MDQASTNGVNGTNGDQGHANAQIQDDSANILKALQIIQNPLTDNAVRRDASQYLEQLKTSPNAGLSGYYLGADWQRDILVRHFGFSLLEHVLRHEWHNLDGNESHQIRECVIQLGRALNAEDPPFLRNKVAQLWVEMAKKSWILDWFDLDEVLTQLWSNDLPHKEFVLTVLENISDDLFLREDSAAVLRGRDLGTALVDIFTSQAEHTGDMRVGGITHNIRYEDQGWLLRINAFISVMLQDQKGSKDVKGCLLKSLATIRSAFSWIMTAAITNSGILPTICNCLLRQDTEVMLAGTEALLALYSRARLEDADIEALVYPMCHPVNSAVLQELYDCSIVATDEMDTQKYVISKKLSEMMSHIADFILQNPPTNSNDIDFTTFFQFMWSIARHESLIVSIPAVHSWTKLLAHAFWRKSPSVATCMGGLIDFACQRTFQYDQLPEDTEEAAVVFVSEEIELFPERQGFYLNYRRLCAQIIELISSTHLTEAIAHVLAKANEVLDRLQAEDSSFEIAGYSRTSLRALQVDAQLTNVESACKGFSVWRSANEENPSQSETNTLNSTTSHLRSWAVDLLTKRSFSDPLIKQRVVKSAVEFSNRALRDDTDFALKVLEHIVASLIPNQAGNSEYTNAVEDLHMYATGELMRLSVHHANYFVTFYDQIQSQVHTISSRADIDEKTAASLTGSLFLIVQRASNIDASKREQRLAQFLDPIAQSWQTDDLQQSLSSFEAFCQAQYLDQVGPYMRSINAESMEDWSLVPLDAPGTQLRKEMLLRSAKLPLRLSRTLLTVSTEKVPATSLNHHLLEKLWTPLLPTLLDAVFKLTNYNHCFHNPCSWPNLPAETIAVGQRILLDRYWQSGITTGSMNDFQTRIRSTKHTVEGFASSVRARVRFSLEHCYSILHAVARLGDPFYNLPNMPSALSEAVISTSGSLSPHHFSNLLGMCSKLIDECPSPHRQHFLTPLISTLLHQLDLKCTTEWQKLEARTTAKSQDDEGLSDEMREDSILRNLTYKSVNMVAMWLDPQRELQKKNLMSASSNGDNQTSPTRSMRYFLLDTVDILEPLLVFCTHAISFPDTKTCSTIVRALRGLVPPFATAVATQSQVAGGVREYISHDLLRAAITALHDGHFVDQQKDIANLIATIWIAYGLPTHFAASEGQSAHERPALTDTPRKVLLSLPGMTEAKVNRAAEQLAKEGGVAASAGQLRHQRAIILTLLEGLRGVRLSELGKIDMSVQKSKLLEKYMRRENVDMQGIEGTQPLVKMGEDGIDLAGVSEMFG